MIAFAIMSQKYKCPVCAFADESLAILHVHCVSGHPKEFFTCAWCTVPFATLRALKMHIRNEKCPDLHKDEPREGEINTVQLNNEICFRCDGRFDSAEAAIKHYKEQHLNFSYICEKCGDYFQHNSSLDIHYAKSHPKAGVSPDASSPSANTVGISGNRIAARRTASVAFDKTGNARQRRRNESLRTFRWRINFCS